MYPKTALKLLGIMIVCIALFFAFISIKQRLDLKLAEDSKLLETNNQESVNIDNIVEKKNKGEELGEEEQKQLEEVINKKKDKKKEREKYTQEELDLIFNPQKTVEEELGIEQEKEKEAERYTQEEL